MSESLTERISAMGIDFVEDLKDLLEDSTLLIQMKENLSSEDLLVFFNVCRYTEILSETIKQIDNNKTNSDYSFLINPITTDIENINELPSLNEKILLDQIKGLEKKIDNLEIKAIKETSSDPISINKKNHYSLRLKTML